MKRDTLTLDDKYALQSGCVFLTGTQALVRLTMLQQVRDQAAGLNTAGYVSGYRGSPLGGLDQTFWKAQPWLDAHHITFQPGINEDLAATAVWGTQQVNLFPGAQYDGVFGLWYGKGPGVDRCGDVFKHANAAGTSRYGGVLVVAGDDHAARSSTLPHQSEHAFKTALMPVLAPASVQEYLDLGLHGWALSRYSGCWVAFKAVADTVESSASVDIDPQRLQIVIPTQADYTLPPGGLNIRLPDPKLEQEARLINHKLYAALAYCRVNHLDRIVIGAQTPARLGIITAGKSYLDVRQAFDDLGIDEALAEEIGIRLYKVGMVWPLEPSGVRRFAEGLDEILVIEEKRQFLEYQLKEELYNWREDVRPRVIGKFDEKGEWSQPHGDWLLPATGELTPARIARVIAERIDRFFTSPRIHERLCFLEAKEQALSTQNLSCTRTPFYCAGCPHNTSTRVPEGSRALAGIGCHYMVTWMNRRSEIFSHMGGEGVTWLGQMHFTNEPHVFANLGDGTYFHSGILAIRAAVAAYRNRQPPTPLPKEGGDDSSLRSGALASHALGRPGGAGGITYKLLYNDAVAMTGGQPVDGPLSVPLIAQQLAAEGVHQMVVVTDGSPRNYRLSDLPHGTAIRSSDELDLIQRELREHPGVSVLIYDQTCAAEKRRRRKRGMYPDPARRLYINEAVCEGCGDCSEQSNCLAVIPVETEWGRKRQIDQSACNKDYTCLNGFCPSFVSIEGGQLRRGRALDAAAFERDFPPLPLPTLPATQRPYGILICGVGGTGVITLGALIGMAAHIDGKGVTVIDMTGLAQKGGAVTSHVRICDAAQQLHAVRIATGEADAVVGGDAIVTASSDALAKMAQGRTRVVVNCNVSPTAEFIHNPDWQFPAARIRQVITETVGSDAAHFIDATGLAGQLLGDAIVGNLFLLGYAWQLGLLPVSQDAIQKSLELNGAAVNINLQAFLWGRRAAHAQKAVENFAHPQQAAPQRTTLSDLIQKCATELTAYQDAAYAQRYTQRMTRIQQAEQLLKLQGDAPLTQAVASAYFKLLAHKDEYEVARLYSETGFLERIAENFEGDYRVQVHLAPPLLARPDPHTGRIKKMRFGSWIFKAFHLLARLRFLRGTKLDIFQHTAERKLARQLLLDYESDLNLILERLSSATFETALALARLPEKIRGFGDVRHRNHQKTIAERHALRSKLSG